MTWNLQEFLNAYNDEGDPHALRRIVLPGTTDSQHTQFILVQAGNRAVLLDVHPFDDYLTVDLHPFIDGQDATAGVFGMSTRSIDRLLEVTPSSAAAVIVFPDEFDPEAAVKALRAAKKHRGGVLLVVVTHDPRRFEELAGDTEQDDSVVVLAKPAWAWTILDTIRARLDAKPADPPKSQRKESRS